MESTSHERVVLWCVAENNKLRRTNALAVSGQLCRFQNDVAHNADSIHVNTASGRADIDGRAQTGCYIQCFRNGTNQFQIAGTESLVYQCGISADKVDTAGFRSTLQSLCKLYRAILRACSSEHCNRCNSNTLVDDRNAVFLFNFFTSFYQLFCFACDFVIDFIASLIDIGIDTIQQRNSHGSGSNIQALILNHADGFENIPCIKQCTIHISDFSCF